MGQKARINKKVKVILFGIPLILIAVIAVSFYKPYYFESNPQNLKSIGMQYLDNNDYTEAIKVFNKVLKYNNEADLQYYLAKAYLKNNQPEKAYEHAMKSLKMNPELSSNFILLGQYNALKGNDKKALSYFNKAIALNNSAEANFAIGKYYYNKNENEKAFEHLVFSQDKNPDNLEIYLLLAEVYTRKGLFVSAYNSYDTYVQHKCNKGIPYAFLITKEADEIQAKMRSLRDMAHEM